MKYLFALLFFWTLTASAQEELPMDPNARDMLILTDWFEGEFDKEEQRWFYTRNGGQGEPAQRRIHAIHKRLDLPQLGEHAFHIQHYLDDDPGNVTRQGGLVWLDPDENGDVYGIRMRDKEYPFYSERPDFLLFSLQKKGQARMVGYALTDVDARRVSFNLGSALGHCHLEGYEFREPLGTPH